MDRLISESEQKFHHYFSPLNEPTLNLSQFVSGQDEEESFSLNSLTEMDVHLLKDKHFNEMYQDVKRYCDATFVKEARHLDRYYVLLAGLLRGLLRACGSTFDPYERKLLVEKVYSWYRDKRKLLLDYRLKSRRRNQQSDSTDHYSQQQQQQQQRVKKLVTDDYEDAIRLEDLEHRQAKNSSLPDIKSVLQQQRTSSPVTSQNLTPSRRQPTPGTPQTEGRQYIGDDSSDFPGPNSITQLPLFVNRDKKKELFIGNKLKQYSRRNLASSHSRRLRNATQKPQSAQQQVRSVSRTQSWSADRDSSQQPVMSDSEAGTGESSKRFISQPRFMNYKDDFDFSKMGVYSHWMEHRSRETEEELENVEFKDTISTWASNRARIEEEIQRRQEASRYSSQTGVTVHKIVRASNNEQESKRHRKRLEELRQKADAFLDSDSEFSEDEREKAPPTRSNPLDAVQTNDSDDENSEEDEHVQTSNSEEEDDFLSNDEPIFLSPYKNLKKVTHQFRPPSPLNPDMNMMNEEERIAASKGFVRPMTTGASTIPRTPIINYHREVDKSNQSSAAEEAASGANRKPYRPKTVSVFDNRHRSNAAAGLGDSRRHHVHYTNPEKEHFHSVLDREGLIEEPKAKKGKKGKGKGKKKAAGGKQSKKTKGKKGADKKAAAPEPSTAPPEPVAPAPRPPSLLRSAQLDEVDRIKLSLSKGGWNVPTSVIQRSILIPEDLSHEECRTNLPTGAFLRLECVMTEEPSTKKKKKGGKKKKKGGKKKKKKK